MDWLWTAEKIHVRKVFFSRLWICLLVTRFAHDVGHMQIERIPRRHLDTNGAATNRGGIHSRHSMGTAVAFLFVSRFGRQMRTGDGRGILSLGAGQSSTQRGRPSRHFDSVHRASFLGWRRRMEVAVRQGSQVLAGTMC